MIKIKAKQIITGKVPSLFFKLFLSFIVSLLGTAVVTASLLGFDNETVRKVFSVRFGEYSFALRIASSVIMCLFGLMLLALGKKSQTMYVCRSVSKKSFNCKSFSFLLYLAVKTLFMLCWGFVFVLPSAVCVSFLIMSLSQGPMEKNVFISWASGCAVLLIIGLAFLFVTAQRYSAWKYYLCSEKNGVVSALYKSIEKTEGRCLEIAAFKLSMTGWLMSCLLIIPVVYVAPYISVSNALFVLRGKTQEKTVEQKLLPAVFEIIREQ